MLLLGLKGAKGGLADAVRGGDKEPVGELGSGRLGKEGVDVALGDGVARGVSLGLDGPELAVVCFGDQVDASVGAPAPWPLLPEPDLP